MIRFAPVRPHAPRLLAVSTSLLVFAALAGEQRAKEGVRLESAVMRLVHAASTPVLDRLALVLSALGSSAGLVLLTSSLVVALLVRGRRGDAVLLVGALVSVGPLVAVLKDLFERTRPALWQSIAPAPGFSFPSAHAAASLTLAAAVIALAWRTRWRSLAILAGASFTLGVGLSRVYLGVHYPSDVVAGWCVASAWVLMLWPLRMLALRQPPAAPAETSEASAR